MKNLAKFFSLLFFLAFAVSCGDDDSESPATDLENAELAFEVGESPITVPNTLAQSSDQNAQQVYSWLTAANGMSSWLSYFTIPPDAQKSNESIGRKNRINGRIKENVLVYTWTFEEGENSISVAYEISENGDNYVFEIFWKYNEGDYQKFIHAEESKDPLRNGFMEIFFTDPISGGSSDEYFFRFEWQETSEQFTFRMFDSAEGFELTIIVNEDNSGSIDLRFDGVKSYEATWNADGTSGTYATYNFSGELISSGNWSA